VDEQDALVIEEIEHNSPLANPEAEEAIVPAAD
jgi:hypothetical protein